MSELALFSSLEGRLKPEPRGRLTELALTLTHCVIWSKSLQLCLQRARQRYLRLSKWGRHCTLAAFASCVAEGLDDVNELFSCSVSCKYTILLRGLLRRLCTVLRCEPRYILHLFIPCFLHWHCGENNFRTVVCSI